MFDWLKKILGLGGHRDAGAEGEQAAADWLRRERGFTIVARNWRSPRDRREEIDLVGRDGEVLVFVEVKTRAADALVPGYHAVDGRKKRVLRRAIKTYLAQLREKPRTFRFDVVEVGTHPSERLRNGPDAVGDTVMHFANVPLFSKHFRP